MKIKKSLLSVLLSSVISASLVGCGTNTDSQQDENNSAQVEQNQNSKPKAAEKKDSSAVKTETSRVGTRTTIKSMKNLSIEQTQGPVRAKITDMQMGKLETNESSKKLFDGKDVVYFVTIAMEVENTSGDTVAVYPDQGTLVTDTKEQVEANMFLSGNKLGGDYIGNVIKKGNVVFITETNPSDIHNIKFTFNGPSDSNFERLGEDFTFDLNIK